MYINKAFIFGNLTRDPEVRALPSGTQVASFAVATNRVYKDKNGVQQKAVDFHNVVVFGKQADIVAQYLKKGRSVFVEGRIQNRSWEGQDGQKKYRTEIVADRFQFGPRTSENNFVQSTDATTPTNAVGAVGKEVKQKDKDSEEGSGAIQYPEEEINADDIPF
ncbi:MAG TPA: single-stranded DNA-binding protein [Candidatus Paceibacterota bacterium]